MNDRMPDHPPPISPLIDHAERPNGSAETASRRVEGDVRRYRIAER